jgi:2-polyprenyl-3-methyl-5-hydroxy-6-metoxy-1,4-benzoquinol methylase
MEWNSTDYFVLDDVKQVKQIIYGIEAIKDIIKFKKEGRLLDIGSAKGIFLFVAKNSGFKVNGLEISKYASDFSRDVFEIDTKVGIIEDAEYPERYFDVITMFDVIEHFQDPYSDLLKIREMLKDDGVIIIDTPNAGSIFSRIRGDKWPGYGRYHLNNFSHETLRKLIDKAGFSIITSKTHKSDIISFDSLWKWGIISYTAYARLEQIFILSKICQNVNAPVMNMYKAGNNEKIRELVTNQMHEAQKNRSTIKDLINLLNFPSNYLINAQKAGDAIRVVAQKK